MSHPIHRVTSSTSSPHALSMCASPTRHPIPSTSVQSSRVNHTGPSAMSSCSIRSKSTRSQKRWYGRTERTSLPQPSVTGPNMQLPSPNKPAAGNQSESDSSNNSATAHNSTPVIAGVKTSLARRTRIPSTLLCTVTVSVSGSTIQNSTAPSPAKVVIALSRSSAWVFDGDFTSITSSGDPPSHFSKALCRSFRTAATSAPQTSFSGSGLYAYSVPTR